MRLRHLGSWKPLFYGGLLPCLGRLGPGRAEIVLRGLGRVFCDRDRRRVEATIRAAGAAIGAPWDVGRVRRELAAATPRFLARDLMLDRLGDAEALGRFDVAGFEAVEAALAGGRGVILLGSHFGAHVAALHWLDRRGVLSRLLVQPPRHLSARLKRRFAAGGQQALNLRRGMGPAEAARCLLAARDALRAGRAVYLSGDVPHASAGAVPARLLGREGRFLAAWAELAVAAPAPVVAVSCTAGSDGRYRLVFEPPLRVAAGGQAEAVARYLAGLEARIGAHPAAAVAHLTWASYGG